MFEKDMRVAGLIDIYGPLLSGRRREIIEMYYFEDLSLAEIADNTGISRQGVRDSIKKSECELRDMENKLHLCERFAAIGITVNHLASRIEKLCPSLLDDDCKELEDIAGQLRSINL